MGAWAAVVASISAAHARFGGVSYPIYEGARSSASLQYRLWYNHCVNVRCPHWFDWLDRRIVEAMAAHGLKLLRLAIGVVFFWFGALKLFPGLSPAETLAGRTMETLTFGSVPAHLAVPALGVWEVAISLGLLAGRCMRVVLVLLFAQMLGTVTPFALFPAETFALFPFVPTLEGQYIIKNIVFMSAAIVLGATLRGGELSPEPVVATEPTCPGSETASDPLTEGPRVVGGQAGAAGEREAPARE